MQLNNEYASFLVAASNVYAAQNETACTMAECQFEERLFKLFEQARKGGVALQDIAVITSTAIAVILTRPDTLPSPKRLPPAEERQHATL